jgi:hypothetical protein
MRVGLASMILAGASCNSKPQASVPPALLPSVARCDLETPARHVCTDVFDPARIAPHEHACANGTFTAGASCPKQSTTRGCILADGSITWIYKGDLACPRMAFTGTPFHYGPLQAYACLQGDSCLEEHSVYDTGPSHVGESCPQGFRAEPCPTEHAIGRCTLDDPDMESSRVIYAPVTGDQAIVVCLVQYHGTFHSM